MQANRSEPLHLYNFSFVFFCVFLSDLDRDRHNVNNIIFPGCLHSARQFLLLLRSRCTLSVHIHPCGNAYFQYIHAGSIL